MNAATGRIVGAPQAARAVRTLRPALLAVWLAILLGKPGSLAAGSYDGRYTLEDGATVRVLTGSDCALLLTAETVGVQSIARNPRLSGVPSACMLGWAELSSWPKAP